jgi:hypothetical protein
MLDRRCRRTRIRPSTLSQASISKKRANQMTRRTVNLGLALSGAASRAAMACMQRRQLVLPDGLYGFRFEF